MADEVVKTIRIETSGAEQTVKGLKDEINSLRDALLNAEKGSDEYRDILEQLIKDQERLTDAMNAGKNGMKAAEGSYNSLVNKMAALKKVWRETADETERNKIGDQIKGIQDKLKGMDGSIHDFRRNVGNYADSIKEAFGAMGGAAKGMVGPINSVKAAFTGLSAHPLVAVLTALAALLVGGITKGFKSSEEATNKLRVAFSGFQAIGDAVTKMFQGLAKIIGDVANGVINFADKLGLLGPKFKARQEMTKKQIELEKKERDSITKTAQIEQEAADLREKASDEENYSISQRIEFLKQAQAKEEEGLQLEKEILEQKVNQLEAQLALTDSTGEELTKLNELKAKLIKVNSDIAKSQTSANKEINALRKRGVQEAAQAQQQLLSLEKELLQQEYDLAVDGSEEQLKLAKELRKKELEIEQEGFKTKIKDRKAYEQAMRLSTEKFNKDIAQIESEHEAKIYQKQQTIWETRLLGYREGSSEYFEEVRKRNVQERDLILEARRELNAKIAKGEGTTIKFRGEDIDTIELDKRFAEINKEIRKTEDDYFMALENEVAQTNRIVLEGTVPLSAMYKKQMEQIRTEIDNMAVYSTDRWGEVIDENGKVINANISYTERVAAKEKELADATKNYWSAVIDEQTRGMRIMSNAWSREIYESPLDKLINTQYQEISANVNYLKMLSELVAEKQNEAYEVIFNKTLNTLKDNARIAGEEITDESISEFEKLAKSWTETRLQSILSIGDTIDNELADVVTDGDGVYQAMDKQIDLLIEKMGMFSSALDPSVVPSDVIDAYLSNLEALRDGEKNILNERRDNWFELSNNIADLMGGIGNVWETSLEIRKKTLEKEGKYNKMEQKSLEQSYENLRLLKIAEATVNTISGAIAAYMKCQELGQPWGTVLGAIQAAVVTATGVAEIGKLKHMDNPYADNSSVLGGSAGGGMSATVIPQVSDYTPDYGVNLTNREDTEYLQEAIGRQRIWVSVSEIDRVQNRVNVAEKEAQF